MRVFLVTLLALLLPFPSSAAGISVVMNGEVRIFSDVPDTAWYADTVKQAAEAGIVSGYTDAQGAPSGLFGPGNTVTIAEALKIAINAAGYDPAGYADSGAAQYGAWYDAYLNVAVPEHIIFNMGNNADYNRPATRGEVASIFAHAFKRPQTGLVPAFSDVSGSHRFANEIAIMQEESIAGGDNDKNGRPTGKFRPDDSINRAETAKLALSAYTILGTPGVGRTLKSAWAEFNPAVVTVWYSDDGFSPAEMLITQGTTVRFKNAGTLSTVVMPDDSNSFSFPISEFQEKEIPPGMSMDVKFLHVGTWGYFNLLKPALKGKIVVE